MKYAAYDQYKPSRIEWLGAVPEHWQVWKIAHGFQMTGSGTTPPPDNPDWYDGDVCWVTTSELRETVITDTEKKISQEALKNFSALKVFPEGALAIAMYGATIGRLGIFGIAAATNQACGVLFGQKAFDTKFVFYWLQAFREQIILLASGGGQPNISQEKVRSVRIACPSIDEQQTITRFLDAKTAQIDALVAQKRQLIAKLKEKRSALIARTVTRGLPPEAAKAAGLEPSPEMKDSGVDWLGAVPVHWDVVRVKFVAKVESGHTPSRSEPSYWIEEECVIPWVSLNDSKFLKENDFISETAVKISVEGMRNSSAHLLPAGAVVFTRDATIGLTAITTVPAAVSQHVIAWLPGERVFAKYLLLVFKVMQNYLDSLTFGSTLKTIGMSDIRRIAMPIPSMGEQQAIAKYLDFEVSQIDGMTDKIELAIARLTEYRQALITSAVTGKIDVRRFDQRTES